MWVYAEVGRRRRVKASGRSKRGKLANENSPKSASEEKKGECGKTKSQR